MSTQTDTLVNTGINTRVNTQANSCMPGAAKLERVNFFNRQLLTADDMTADSRYYREKSRLHNIFMHGCGVVCGLIVAEAPTAAQPWRVSVSAGYALGPYGDEIFVGEAVYFDLAQCASGGKTSPCEPSTILAGAAGTSSTVYLAIKYAECLARPVRTASSGCGCDSDPCQYSRIIDSFQIQCLPTPPAQPPPPLTLCQAMQNPVLLTCPPCPTSPWVVLATITLPSSTSMDIANTDIDNSTLRQVLLSTALIQSQVYRCCCGQKTSPGGTLTVNQTWQQVQNFFAANAGPVVAATFSITVTNTGSTAANVTVTVALSASGDQKASYEVTPATGWATAAGANLTSLTSQPFTLAAGATSTALAFEVSETPGVAVFAFNLTSDASAAAPGFTGGSMSVTVPFGNQ